MRILTIKGATINGFAASSVASRKITGLYHEIFDHPMEYYVLVVQLFFRRSTQSPFARAQSSKILARSWRHVSVQFENNTASWQTAQ